MWRQEPYASLRSGLFTARFGSAAPSDVSLLGLFSLRSAAVIPHILPAMFSVPVGSFCLALGTGNRF